MSRIDAMTRTTKISLLLIARADSACSVCTTSEKKNNSNYKVPCIDVDTDVESE